MASPPSKGERTRRTLLGLAVARFAAVGYQATAVADICREAGMSTTAAYAYFPNKEDLFAEAVDADVDDLIHEALEDVLAGDFDGDWSTLFLRLLGAVESHPLARRVLAGDEGKGVERLLVLPAEAALRAGLAAALRQRQTSGEVRADIDPDVIAIGLETLLITVLIATLQTGGVADPERAAGILAVFEAAIHAPIGTGTFPEAPRSKRSRPKE